MFINRFFKKKKEAKNLVIEYVDADYSCFEYDHKTQHQKLMISKKEPNIQLTIAHELAHAIYFNIIKKMYWNISEDTYKVLASEYLAWALAKSFLKPQYWNEKYVLDCLFTYFDTAGLTPPTKIPEINKIIDIQLIAIEIMKGNI